MLDEVRNLKIALCPFGNQAAQHLAEQGIAPDIEELIVGADPVELEHLGEGPGDQFLKLASWRLVGRA